LGQQPVNVSAGLDQAMQARIARFRGACGPNVFDELVRLNALDTELVDLARNEVRRRFSLVPNGPERLRALQQAVKTSI